jgi:Tol biopolymer transport system component
LLIATNARAQFGVPFAKYRTFETPHFILTFEAGLEDYARRTAARAEAAYAQLTRAYGSTPRGKIRITVVDQGDVFNGSATPYPTNRILAFAHTPVEGYLFYTRDPVELLITHELAHVFHLDEARGGWRALRWVFGRGPMSFPHFFDGSFLIEGLATFYESRLTDGGRVRGSQFHETLRAALLETEGPKLDEAEADSSAWPLDRHYVYGSLFLDHLADQYGVETPPAWMSRRGGSFASIVTRGAGVGNLFGGKSLSREWADWIAIERDEALRLQERLRTEPPGLATTRRVCDVAHRTAFPRISPDGSRIAFVTTDEGRRPLGLYVANLETCDARRMARVDSARAFTWSPDSRTIVFSQLSLVDNARMFADLYRIDIASGDITRLTRQARLSSPDLHPSGRTIVAVQYDGDRSRLVTVDAASGSVTPLTGFSAAIAWGPARWSPDGTRLAALRFTRGVSFDLVLLSADGQLLQTLTDDRAIEGTPEWDASAPAGVLRLFFTSDRSGIRELYALELDGSSSQRLYLTARVATGLHEVTVVPDADSDRASIVAIVTHADGDHLERLDIDRAAWIAAPAPAAQYAQRPADPPPLAAPKPPGDGAPAGGGATTTGAGGPEGEREYGPARDLLPTGWRPVFGSVEELGLFLGGVTEGVDVIGRHSWQGYAAYGPDGRVIGAARYLYERFPRALLFGGVSSTWRLEQRIVAGDAELLRLERKRSAAAGIAFPFETFRRRTLISASVEVEDRHRENVGDLALTDGDPIQEPTLVGGSLGVRFGNTQAGLRSISVQDGVRLSAAMDYFEAPDSDRWRSGWEMSASVYRSFPSWTTSGRPVFGATARVAEQRGPAASRLTVGGLGSTFDDSGSDFMVRGYPPGFVAASAVWSASTEMRLPITRISRGLGELPLYLRGFSASWFVDSAGVARNADQLGSPQLLSTGAQLSSDFTFFSFAPTRIRTGIGVPLKAFGPITRGEARFYITAETLF